MTLILRWVQLRSDTPSASLLLNWCLLNMSFINSYISRWKLLHFIRWYMFKNGRRSFTSSYRINHAIKLNFCHKSIKNYTTLTHLSYHGNTFVVLYIFKLEIKNMLKSVALCAVVTYLWILYVDGTWSKRVIASFLSHTLW